MIDKKVIVKIKKYKIYEIIKTLSKYNIYYNKLDKKQDGITLEINYKDYKKLKALFKKNTKIIKQTGIYGLIETLKKHYIFIISIILSYFVILILSNVCFGINIETNNNELKKIIIEELDEFEIKEYKFKKDYNELTKIKNKILEDNKDKLEWLEITENGVYYNISLTERIIKETPNVENEIMDIVSTKDALVQKVIIRKGTDIKYVNDYVKKGEVIISGDIIKNEEVVGNVIPDGDIYGEVWYTVTTTVPYNFIEYTSTGEKVNHYYINFLGNKMTILGKFDYNNVFIREETIIDKPYIFFKLMKEEKEIFEYKELTLSSSEAYEEALKRSDKSINAKLNDDEYIIDKKVLKKNEFSSKIEIEVFYRVYENIGKLEKRITNLNEEEQI